MTHADPADASASPARPRHERLRFLLRERTAEAHAELDATVGAFDGRDGYARYLDGLLGFRAPVERAVAGSAAPDWFGGFATRPIAALIRADRADLQLPPLDQSSTAPAPGSSSALVGTLYVLEGSALGARLLYRRALAMGFTDAHGARHLAAQAGDRESWPRFMALLEHPAIDASETISAALATFAAARAAFRAACAPPR